MATKPPTTRKPATKPSTARVPASAKKPTDRKPAAAKTPQRKPAAQIRAQMAEAFGEPITVEVDGMSVTVSADDVDDIDFLESIAVLEAGGRQAGFAAFTALHRLLGDEQYAAVKEHYRDPDTGRTPASKVTEFFYLLYEEMNNPNS